MLIRLPAFAIADIILAQAGTGEGFSFAPLINVGAVGVVLAFVLWKLEPRMRGAEQAIDRLARAICVLVTELPHVLLGAKRQCEQIITELDDAARNRGDR